MEEYWGGEFLFLPSPLGEKAPRRAGQGELAAASRKHAIMAGSPLISQRAGPLTASPAGKPFYPEGLTSMRTFGIRSACGFPPGGGVPDAPRGMNPSPALPFAGACRAASPLARRGVKTPPYKSATRGCSGSCQAGHARPYSSKRPRPSCIGKARPVCMQLYQLKQLPAERGQWSASIHPRRPCRPAASASRSGRRSTASRCPAASSACPRGAGSACSRPAPCRQS